MTDNLPAKFASDFAALCTDETPFGIVSTRYRLWCLICAVQVAMRHPNARRSVLMGTAVDAARALQELLSTTPALAQILERGWDLNDAMWASEKNKQ